MSEARVLDFPKATRFYIYYDRHSTLPGPDGYAFRICVGGTYFHCRGVDIQCPTKGVIQKDGSPKAIIEGYAARIEIDENDYGRIE